MAQDKTQLPTIAKSIATPNYLNQPETVILQALSGRFADGLGEVRNERGARASIRCPGIRWPPGCSRR